MKKILGFLVLALLVSYQAKAITVTVTERGQDSYGRYSRGTISMDATYPTGGETITAATFGLSNIGTVEFDSERLGYLFDYVRATASGTTGKVVVYSGGNISGTVAAPTFTGTAIASESITLTDDDAAATNGKAVFIQDIDGIGGRFISDLATSVDGTGTLATSGSFYTVAYDSTSAPARGKVYRLYFDEDATTGSRFLANFINQKDHYVALPNGTTIKIVHSATASSLGVAVYFKKAGTQTAKLLFVSPTNANGTNITDTTIKAYTGVDSGTNSAPAFTGTASLATQVSNGGDLSGLTNIGFEAHGR